MLGLIVLLVALVLIALVVTGRMDPVHAILAAVAVAIILLLLGNVGELDIGNGNGR